MGMNRALAAAGAAIALWATLAWLGVMLRAWPPFLLVGCALIVGAACSIHRIREWRVPPGALALGVYGLFGFHFLLFLALRRAPPVEANLVNYLWPLFIVLLAPLFVPGMRLGIRHVAAGFAGFAGAALLITGGRIQLDPAHASGYAMAAGSALVWATYSLASRRQPTPTAAIGACCLASGLAAIACHVALEPRFVPPVRDLALLGVLGLGPMGAAFYLWDYALKHGDPRTIGAAAYLTPLASTLLLVASGQGTLGTAAVAGMALIVGGAALGALPAGRGPRRLAPRPDT
jgi:drug/metabolite transporter (DMT)-like permease